MLKEITTVDDDLGEISSAFRSIIRRSPDFLVVVGGLGPTPDDMTLKGIGKGLGVRIRLSGDALKLIKQHYERRGIEVKLTPARMKMAKLPVGSEAILNEHGTAPGVRVITGKTIVYCLPGVPVEMRGIFRRSVEPEVRQKLGKLHRRYVTLRLEGVLESALAPVISDELKRHPAAYIKSHPRGIREGVSRIELDVAIVGVDSKAVDAEAESVIEEMTSAVAKGGGRVASRREGAP